MALPTSGSLSIANIYTYRSPSLYGWGGSANNGQTNLNWYRGRTYFYLVGANTGANSHFPTGQISISNFYGTSPVNEWNCNCTGGGDCACGK